MDLKEVLWAGQTEALKEALKEDSRVGQTEDPWEGLKAVLKGGQTEVLGVRVGPRVLVVLERFVQSHPSRQMRHRA